MKENWVSGSVHQFSCSAVSHSLQPHGLQHTKLPCPSLTPAVYSNSCPSSRWCHPTISSSVVPFFPCPQSRPASESFPMSQLFAGGGQSIRVSVLCPTLCDPMDCSMPSFPVHHQLPELAQTHVHQVSDAIQPSHPLSSPLFLPSIFPASGSFPMSQFFTSGGQSIGVSASASVLPINIQDWFPLGLTDLISLQSKGLSTVFSNITV